MILKNKIEREERKKIKDRRPEKEETPESDFLTSCYYTPK